MVYENTVRFAEGMARVAKEEAVALRRHLILVVRRASWKSKSTIDRFGGINIFEAKIFSQNGEDGIIAGIFAKICSTNKFFVEFGVGGGNECNTRYLLQFCRWQGLMMDAARGRNRHVKHEFINAENINSLLEKYHVPFEFDLLAIDIDGNDYWVWKALDNKYRPRVVVIEYNAKYEPPDSVAIEYDAHFQWDQTDYFGASLSALAKLAMAKGYTLVGCDSQGVNAFFVNAADARNHFQTRSVEELYRPPKFGLPIHNYFHPPSGRSMIGV